MSRELCNQEEEEFPYSLLSLSVFIAYDLLHVEFSAKCYNISASPTAFVASSPLSPDITLIAFAFARCFGRHTDDVVGLCCIVSQKQKSLSAKQGKSYRERHFDND